MPCRVARAGENKPSGTGGNLPAVLFLVCLLVLLLKEPEAFHHWQWHFTQNEVLCGGRFGLLLPDFPAWQKEEEPRPGKPKKERDEAKLGLQTL